MKQDSYERMMYCSMMYEERYRDWVISHCRSWNYSIEWRMMRVLKQHMS